jgi:hypothetical protein
MKRTILIVLILCTVFFITASSCLAQVINGCVGKNGQLSVVTGPGQCKPNETPVSWGTIGPQGPAGPAGLQGIQGGYRVRVVAWVQKALQA